MSQNDEIVQAFQDLTESLVCTINETNKTLLSTNAQITLALAELKDIKDRVYKIEVWKTGNGNPERGVEIRLDRIEQRQVAKEKRENIRSAIYIGLVVAMLPSIIISFHDILQIIGKSM